MLYPLTEILSPGAISKGRLENNERLGVSLELMFDIKELRRLRPSPDFEFLVSERFASATRSR